jgi:hypothetical protein
MLLATGCGCRPRVAMTTDGRVLGNKARLFGPARPRGAVAEGGGVNLAAARRPNCMAPGTLAQPKELLITWCDRPWERRLRVVQDHLVRHVALAESQRGAGASPS